MARSASSRTVSPTNVVISNQTGSSTEPHFTGGALPLLGVQSRWTDGVLRWSGALVAGAEPATGARGSAGRRRPDEFGRRRRRRCGEIVDGLRGGTAGYGG